MSEKGAFENLEEALDLTYEACPPMPGTHGPWDDVRERLTAALSRLRGEGR